METAQKQLSKPTNSATKSRAPTATTTPPLYIGGGLPPIPGKLVRRIQNGHFIDMTELLPDNLEAANATDNDQSKAASRKHQDVTHIIDWIQCFSTYIAVASRAKPERVLDLIAYLNLIINSQRGFEDLDWASYDHQFRQKASITSTMQWDVMEGTLWNWSRSNSGTRLSSLRSHSSAFSTKKVPICLEWNEYPSEGCPHHNCHYEHVCYRCINIPAITDNRHKAIHCPNKERKPLKQSRR